ncbi:carboxypeptidase regulatory-like domain-containing protein [Polynucleobacter sp. AP-Capit-er-40B-B4]|uniref:carboxypeptidase-like regulatory domain-containing protein n=1 Tax=Polynucleobacter sp. AP-Capit-er-40B-B4 TaxID=2576927 RepID=UPI001C0CC1A6|nr:carboxypeptidase-like regulatory domain-containing protein [Polynucleobacter sp. AP-Capit-er-40B-B4]MBU3581601.1 carboxypeptidase regulatory-like domain-containing protein [Polynucleobacter sp. AP-Capit-er-40B-B4]
MKTLLKIILSAHLILMSSLSLAQIPETQYSQGISYITGGVGEGETVAILAEAKQWPLLLEMSQIENGRGVWIFGATIKIMSSAKKQIVFEAQADGPYMLVNLAPGDYTIEATYEGVMQKRALSIKADLSQKIALFWK